MNLADVRAALVDALDAQLVDVTVTGFAPLSINPPHVWVSGIQAVPDTFGAGSWQLTLACSAAVSPADREGAFDAVDALVSSGGIEDALGDATDYSMRLVRVSNIGALVTIGGTDYVGFEFEVEVLA